MTNSVNFDLFAMHFVDNIDKKLPGAAFTVLAVSGDSKRLVDHVSEGSYMDASIDGLRKYFAGMRRGVTHPDAAGVPVQVTLHMACDNLFKQMVKLINVFDSLDGLPEDKIDTLINLKMRRPNRSMSPNHEQLCDMVKMMVHMKSHCGFKIRAVKSFLTNADMMTAHLNSEAVLIEKHTDSDAA